MSENSKIHGAIEENCCFRSVLALKEEVWSLKRLKKRAKYVVLHHAKFHLLWTKQVYRTLELKINLWLGIRALRNHEATKQEIDAWEINSFH